MTGPTGEDREPNGRAPEEPAPEAAARADGTPDGTDADSSAAEGRAPEGGAPEPSASEEPAGGEGAERHAAPSDEAIDEAIDSGTDVSPQLGGEGADMPVAPKPAGRPPGRFLRVVRWLTSANPVVISVLSIFSALVIGAILIVIGDRPVISEFNYFFAQPGTALSG
ncbi:MAG TPA: hypothetical protein VE132_16675, partial [Micromonosporaceae bacterium]|nr:hypothetical protein [Micromonosporaceae bacterium]